MNVSCALRFLFALTLSLPAQAGCRDSPQPRVDWTGCSRNMLMLGGDDLTDGVFSRATLTSTDFRRAKMPRAKLNEAEVSFARFEGADLSDADYSKAGGWRVNFSKALLERINFSGADFSRAVLADVMARSSNFSKTERAPASR